MLKHSLSLVSARRDLYQAKLVFYLFIASLAMFFVASLATYCFIRVEAFRPVEYSYNAVTNSMVPSNRVYEPLRLPISFWASTGLLVLISVYLQRSVWFIRRENQAGFRSCLTWSLAFAIFFVAVQSFGLADLLNHHFSRSDGSTKVYGMSFTLALIHALHVLGGVIFLGYVMFQAIRDRYDHERHYAVDHCAGYWHFLDIVWVTMLVMFAVTK